jgi:glycosyltransferase involved in cell wall biosynthesis
MNKAILLTYTFPPLSSGGTSVVLNMCRYLPRFNWEVIPVTVTQPVGMSVDQSLLSHIPEGTRVIRVPHGKTAAQPAIRLNKSPLQRAISFIVHNYILVPDRLITWKPAVLPVLKDLIEKEKPECIISFGPLHSLHLIARAACRKSFIPHIPFFGDLWLADSYVEWPSRINRIVESLLERKVVLDSRGIIATTEGSTGYFIDRFGDRCPPTHVAENSYDPERTGKPAPPMEHGEFLTVGWTGNFFAKQSPDELLLGFEMFFKRNPDSRIRFRMAGGIDRLSIQRLEREPLAGRVTHAGHLSWDEVPEFQRKCDLLITCLSARKGSELKNSSKTAEYLMSGRSILAVVPEGDMAERIREYGRGYIAAPRADDIALMLENIEFQWRTSSLNLPIDYRAIEQKFSANRVMERLAGFLDKMAAP